MFYFLSVLLICFNCLFASYTKPASLEEQTWTNIQPHLLPEDHPMKQSLDKLFAKSRWTESLKSLEKGKFVYKKHKKWLKIVVAKHPKLPRHILKLYTDDQIIDSLNRFLRRIWGANGIRRLIENHNYGDLFKVPNKWLYPLPDAEESRGLQRHNFVLVTEDVDLVAPDLNHEHWRSSKISKAQIEGLFTIIKEGGLNDSTWLDNVPFCRDGKIAFSDTEHFNGIVDFHRLDDAFSSENQKFWNSLIEKNQ